MVPLRSDLGFGGIVEGVGFGGTQYVVEVLVRGSVHARITDAAGCTLKEGLPVYVRVEGRRQTFGVTAEGGVLAGEILFVEEQLKGTVIEVAPLGWTVSVRS